MRIITLMSATIVGLTCLSILPASAAITRLTADDRAAILNQKFDVASTTSSIPKCVREAFAQTVGTKTFAMADPGQAFQSSEFTYNGKLPYYRLVFAGRSDKYYVIEALRGGTTPGSVVFLFTLSAPKKNTTFVIHQVHGDVPHTGGALVFDSTPESAQLVWYASEPVTGGSLDSVRKAIQNDKMTDTGFDVTVPATSDPSSPGNLSPMATINKAW